MKVLVSWVDQVKQLATNNVGHQVCLDGPVDLGGKNSGIRPMEALLISLGGCANIEFVHILKKMHVDVIDCSVEVQGKRRDEIPKIFTNIHLIFNIQASSELSLKKAQKAISLTLEKYCSVATMLSKSTCISSECIILN